MSTIKNSKILLMFACIYLMSACVVQSDFSFAGGGTPGFDNSRLNRIDDAIEAEISAGKIPGAVALISRNGQTVYHKSFGLANIESGAPMQNDSIFRIASMTKAVTTVAVMQLYEKGLFQLNDPISKYIPAFAKPSVLVSANADGVVTEKRPASREIKIIDLLTHSSGIAYPFIPSSLQKVYVESGIIDGLTDQDVQLGEQMAKLAKMPLLFDPGSKWNYGLSTDVLGYLIEVMSGKPLNRYFREEIFVPLQMEDTFFYLPAAKHARLVGMYAETDGKLVSYTDDTLSDLGNINYPATGAMTYYSGGAGLSSTAYDYARFIEMLLNDGELDGKRLLGRKAVELMQTPIVDWNDDGVADFGLGFEVISNLGASGELGSEGIYSWGGAFNTSYWIDPREQMIGVIMTQIRPTSSDITDRFKTLAYQALE